MRDAFVEWAVRDVSWAGMPFHFWTAVWFLFGSMVGSFLNVVIYRMPLGMSVVRPGSHCPRCEYAIPLILNIPIVSWLWLRGRCRNCATSISPRYVAVEAFTGLLFAGTWWHWGHDEPVMAVCLFAFWGLLIAATFIDFAHFIIPDEITIGGAVLGVLATVVAPVLHHQTNLASGLKSSAWGIFVGFGVVYGVVRLGKLLFGKVRLKLEPGATLVFHSEGLSCPDQNYLYEDIFYRPGDTIRIEAARVELPDRCYPACRVELALAAKPAILKIGEEILDPAEVGHMEVVADETVLPREAMGFGDVKFMATLGAWLGWKATLFSLGMASFFGAAVGLTLLALGRGEQNHRLPFGPYLTLGAVIWVWGGWVWWERMFGWH